MRKPKFPFNPGARHPHGRPGQPGNFQRNPAAFPGASVQPSSSAIRKLVGASNRFGNSGIKNQQLTSFEIFHYLPFDGTAQVIPFFEAVNTAVFPFANIQENRLQVGESMIIQRVWFTIATVDTGVLTDVQTFDEAALPGLYLSQMNWLNDNNRVIKEISLTQGKAEFNRKAYNNLNNVIHLDTDITIQPLLRFVNQVRTPNVGGGLTGTFIGCHAAGVGTLLAPKTTY